MIHRFGTLPTILLALMLAAPTGCGGEAPEPAAGLPVETSPQAAKFDPSLSDPEAIEIAQATYEAMGGAEGFARAAQIRFRFVVEREGIVISQFAHAWDRTTGRYRLEGTQVDGKELVAYFNIRDWNRERPVGEVYLSGRILDDFEEPPYLDQMYGRFINDIYWLLMPAKLLDPGVVLKYEGEEAGPDGDTWDILHVTFLEGTGLTSKDRYWAYINRRTHLMDRWRYLLQGDPEDADPTLATWEEWNPHGPLVLATRREFPDRPYRLLIADLEVSETVDPDLYEPPVR
jgi:hypothetical protein